MNRLLRGMSWAGGRRASQVEDRDSISPFELVSWGKMAVDERFVKTGVFINSRYQDGAVSYQNITHYRGSPGFCNDTRTDSLPPFYGDCLFCKTMTVLPIRIEVIYHSVSGGARPYYHIDLRPCDITFGITSAESSLGSGGFAIIGYVDDGHSSLYKRVGAFNGYAGYSGAQFVLGYSYRILAWIFQDHLFSTITTLETGAVTTTSYSYSPINNKTLVNIRITADSSSGLIQGFRQIRISNVLKGRWKV